MYRDTIFLVIVKNPSNATDVQPIVSRGTFSMRFMDYGLWHIPARTEKKFERNNSKF